MMRTQSALSPREKVRERDLRRLADKSNREWLIEFPSDGNGKVMAFDTCPGEGKAVIFCA